MDMLKHTHTAYTHGTHTHTHTDFVGGVSFLFKVRNNAVESLDCCVDIIWVVFSPNKNRDLRDMG